MRLFIGFLFLYIFSIYIQLVWSFKSNKFMEKESERIFKDIAKSDKNWTLNGRVYKNGFTVIEDDKTKRNKNYFSI